MLPSILNGTFKKGASAKFNDTFKKSPQYKSSELINDDLNRTITIVDKVDSNRLNNTNTKRHSLILDNHKGDSNHVTNLKRNSIAYSAGSTDSLDYSSLSNSSKGSNKMLNMAEVDAIVLQQEQSKYYLRHFYVMNPFNYSNLMCRFTSNIDTKTI